MGAGLGDRPGGLAGDGPSAAAERPLAGLRVVDLTQALSGPYATLLLAGLGAEVVKVESPRGGDLARENSPYVGRDGVSVTRRYSDDLSISHLTRSRGKRGVTLDLKHPLAAEVFADLVRVSDVVVENYASGTADRLGIGYPVLRGVNPRVVYCSLSGFGADAGRGEKAMDVLIQALSGAMYAGGGPDDPPLRMGIPVADMLAPVFGVMGILAALHQRERTGEGQHVDVSMLGALTSFVAIENWRAMELAGMPARTGPTLQRLAPFGVFRCADGYVALVAVQDHLANALFRAMGTPELAEDPRFSSRDARVANAPDLEARIEAWTGTRPLTEVVKALESHGVPSAPVRDPQSALADPRVTARGETVPVSHPDYPSDEGLRTAGVPIRFSAATTGQDDVVPVTLGAHNQEVYGALLGYSAERIATLATQGVI